MAENVRIELAEAKMELLRSIQDAREYAVEQAEKKRNQAIGALGFAALVLSLASWLLIDQTIERRLDDLGRAKLLQRAEAAAKATEDHAKTAKTLVEGIEKLGTSYSEEFSQLTAAVGEVAALRSSLDGADTRTEYEWAGGGVIGGANAIWKKAECPAGQVLVGLNLLLGGTCSRACDPDGRPVAQVKAICRPLRNEQADLLAANSQTAANPAAAPDSSAAGEQQLRYASSPKTRDERR